MRRHQPKVWSPEEDAALNHLVALHGTAWKSIELILARQQLGPSKSASDCRSRWNNRLTPGLKTGRWSFEERQHVFALHQQFGNQWAKIARTLGRRSDVAVKNFFYYVVKQEVLRRWSGPLDWPQVKQRVLQLVRDKTCTQVLGLACSQEVAKHQEAALASAYQEWLYWAELLESLTGLSW